MDSQRLMDEFGKKYAGLLLNFYEGTVANPIPAEIAWRADITFSFPGKHISFSCTVRVNVSAPSPCPDSPALYKGIKIKGAFHN